jgi:aminoglycoside 2''-phosphotransferase
MNKIERLISKCGADLKIETIEYLDEGDFCRAYLVNKNLVFRFAKHAEAQQSLRREVCLLPQIAARVSLQIPQPEFSSFAGKPTDSFAAYRFLQDNALTREEYLKLDAERRTICAEQVADFLNELHSSDVKLAENCGVKAVKYAATYAELLKQFRKKLAGRLEKAVFEFAVGELENYLKTADIQVYQPVLLHGDLSPDHVLFDGERVTSILDFGDMMIGDAAWDFLWIYEDYGADFFARAVSKYQTKNKISFIKRVVQFSKLEAIQWVLDCLKSDDADFSEAVENLQLLSRKD